jgi:hypothetical protein
VEDKANGQLQGLMVTLQKRGKFVYHFLGHIS